MKLLVDAAEFAAHIAACAEVVPAKATNEILRHIMLEAENDQVLITGSDLSVTVRHLVKEINVVEPGGILVAGADLLKILKAFGKREVCISIGKGLRCIVESTEDKDRFKVAGDDPKDYPDLRKWDGEGAFEIRAENLRSMVARTAYAASKTTGRYAMNGLKLEITSDRLRLVATDGRRLAICDCPCESGREVDVLVPVAALELLSKIADEGSVIEVQMDDLSIHFRTGNYELISRQIAGQFPPYEEVIPEENEIKVRVNRKLFLSKLKLAVLLNSKSSKAVRFVFDRDLISITSYEGRTKEANIEYAVDYGYEEMTIGFDPFHMVEGVSALKVEEFDFELKDPASFAVFRESTDDGISFLYAFVPVNLSQ